MGPRVVGEAADSLGMLLNHTRAGESPETAPSNEIAVLALQARFRDTPPEQIELRERILGAMANIADSSFGASFRCRPDCRSSILTLRPSPNKRSAQFEIYPSGTTFTNEVA